MSQSLRIAVLLALASHHAKRLPRTMDETELMEHTGCTPGELHDALDILESQGLAQIRAKTADGAYHPDITPQGLLAVEQLREAAEQSAPPDSKIGF